MPRRRRKHVATGEHHDRWAIPYGDLITLLMSFFVVMYALSDISLGKYQTMAQSLSKTFRAEQKSATPLELGDIDLSPIAAPAIDTFPASRSLDPIPPHDGPGQKIDPARRDAMLRAAQVGEGEEASVRGFVLELENSVRSQLQDLSDNTEYKLINNGLWVELQVNTETVFASGSAGLSAQARRFFKQLGARLAGMSVRLRVEGFTDDVPIHNRRFPSNWELSVGRAGSLVHILVDGGVAPERIVAAGYGATRPLAPNISEQARRDNRRVVLVMLRNSVARKPFPTIGKDALRSPGGKP